MIHFLCKHFRLTGFVNGPNSIYQIDDPLSDRGGVEVVNNGPKIGNWFIKNDRIEEDSNLRSDSPNDNLCKDGRGTFLLFGFVTFSQLNILNFFSNKTFF